MSNYNFTSIRDAVGYYLDCGLEPIPLKPLSKEPFLSNWNKKPLYDLWENIDCKVNVGLRCGGDNNFAVIDCDNKKSPDTFKNVISYLEDRKIPYLESPIVETSSKVGRHIYIKTTERIYGNSFKKINPIHGCGELRFGTGAFVVAPPSHCENPYVFINGDVSNIPTIHLEDLQGLVDSRLQVMKDDIGIPRRSYELLLSPNLGNYKSESEKEQAIITGIVNAARNEGKNLLTEDFEEFMYQTFQRYKPRKFQNKHERDPSEARKYISICFRKSVDFTNKDSSFRKKISNAIYWAKAIPWKGRTGAIDRAVYIAHAQIAYRKGTMPYHASCRDLAILSNVSSPNTISEANKRLVKMGYINLVREGVARLANVYIICNIDTLPLEQPVRECPVCVRNDSFCWGALNKTGYEVYTSLIDMPLTVKEIAEKTGRGLRTIKNKLRMMANIRDANTGEIIEIVKEISGKWIAIDVDFDKVAKAIGVLGKDEKKVQKFTRERRSHNKSLLLGSLKKGD